MRDNFSHNNKTELLQYMTEWKPNQNLSRHHLFLLCHDWTYLSLRRRLGLLLNKCWFVNALESSGPLSRRALSLHVSLGAPVPVVSASISSTTSTSWRWRDDVCLQKQFHCEHCHYTCYGGVQRWAPVFVLGVISEFLIGHCGNVCSNTYFCRCVPLTLPPARVDACFFPVYFCSKFIFSKTIRSSTPFMPASTYAWRRLSHVQLHQPVGSLLKPTHPSNLIYSP